MRSYLLIFTVLLFTMSCSRSWDNPNIQILPSVFTYEVSGITTYSAILSGKILDEGESLISECGICYDIIADPTVTDVHVELDRSNDEFWGIIPDLEPGTRYYARAYAKNSSGTSYGNEVSFDTKSTSKIVITDPEFPRGNDPVTVYFNAKEGNQGLMGFDGDVYAHTGVITINSAPGEWRYTMTDWGENTPETKMSRLSDHFYYMVIEPSIRDYYGIAPGEAISSMAFVFRNNDGSLAGKDIGNKDIFIEVSDSGK